MSTAFSKLSETAQNIIVDAVLGEPKPASIPDSVRAEIAAWAACDENTLAPDKLKPLTS